MIHLSATMLKAGLLQICKQQTPTPNFLVDNVLKKYGHDCLKLHAYQADLNAIELIWATMKRYIARRNVTFKMTDMLVVPLLQLVKMTRFVEEVKNTYWQADIAV